MVPLASLPALVLALAAPLAVAGSAPGAPAPEPLADVAGRLADLAAPESAVREAAERWLAGHLAERDAPAVLAALRSGDLEVRRRLERVLAADDRRLGLALALLASAEPALAAAGRGAVALSLERWNPELVRTGLVRRPAPGGGSRFRDELADLFLGMRLLGPPEAFVLDLGTPLEDTLGLLRRTGRLPFELVLAPGFSGRRGPSPGTARAPADPALGAWDHLLLRLADEHGACLHAVGLRPAAPGGFVLLAPRAAAERSGVEHVLDWLARAARPGQEAVAARQALVDTGWPGYLAYLAGRWERGGDEEALLDLTRAAAGGRVAPRFARERSVRVLLARAPAWLGEASPEGLRQGHLATLALGNLGPTLADGSATLDPLLEGWADADRAGRWVRLAALEALAVGSSRAAAVAAEVLAAPAGTVREDLLLQALRAWVRSSSPPADPPVVGDLAGLFAAAGEPDDVRDRVFWLDRAGLAPPRELEDPANVPGAWGEGPRLALIGTWLAGGTLLPGARQALAWLRAAPAGQERARGERLADLLTPGEVTTERGLAVALLARCRALAEGEAELQALDRVALLAGVLPAQEVVGLLEASVRNGDWSGQGIDLALLGAVGGVPRFEAGEGARQTLGAIFETAVQAAGPEPPRELLRALERSLGGLFAGGDDGNAQLLLRRLQRVLFTAREGWAAALPRYEWPPSPGVGRHRLDRRERRYRP